MKANLPPITSSLSARLGTLLAVLLTVTVSASAATDLATQKLFGKWTGNPAGSPPANYGLGRDLNCAALSSKWVVIGAATAQDRGAGTEGGVQVFHAATGLFARKLLPPGAPAANQAFGGSVTISGDLAVIGAYATGSNRGIAYIYNLTNGALLRTLSAADGLAGDFFGYNIATNGTVVVVGAYGDDSSKGSIYLFNVATGAQIAKIQAADGAGGHYFSYGLAMEGNIIAVGSDGADGNKGAVYFYDVSTQTLIQKYQPGSWVADDHFGAALAMHQGRVIIGNYNSGKAWLYDLAAQLEESIAVGGTGTSFGATVAINGPIMAVSEEDANGGVGQVHLFRSMDGSFLQTLLPPNGDTSGQSFGNALALDGTTLLATAPDDSVQATNAGAAHLIRPLTQPMDYTKAMAKGDFAPGAPDISYGTINEAFTNDDGCVFLTPTLTGAGSNNGKDTAAFGDIVTDGTQELLFRSRQPFLPGGPGVFYGAISRIASNDDELAIGYASLTGAGITAANNQLVWFKTNVSTGTLLRTGTAVAEFGGALLATVPEAVASNQFPEKQCAALCTLKLGGATDATNDSGLWVTSVGGTSESKREGNPALAPLPEGTLGQFAPRVCYHFRQQVYGTALVGANFPTTANAAIFRRTKGDAEELVAQKNDLAVDGTGAVIANARYASFIGEAADGAGAPDGVVYRATLTGPAPAVTPATNEGLWRLSTDSVRRLILRKGQILTNPAGLKIGKFINYWATGFFTSLDQVLVLVQLSGTGVNASNDQALLLYQSDDSLLLLMREGESAPGCPGAKIGVISHVEVEPYSSYYALTATLTGAPVGTEQALYTGDLTRGDTTGRAPLRRPFLRLRKGQLFDNQPSKIKSIGLPTTNLTASGAGATGRGRAISYGGKFVFIVEFDNGVRQVMKGVHF